MPPRDADDSCVPSARHARIWRLRVRQVGGGALVGRGVARSGGVGRGGGVRCSIAYMARDKGVGGEWGKVGDERMNKG